MGSDGRRLWWQLSTDRRNAVESNARCQEELTLAWTFSTFPRINNVNPISLGFNLMNQNEALAHESLAHCHRWASQLKLWAALLFMHYSQTAQLSADLFLLSGGSWRPGPNVHRSRWDGRRIKSAHTCVFWVPVNVCGCSWCRCLGFFWLDLLSALTWSSDVWAAMMSHSKTAWVGSGEPNYRSILSCWSPGQTFAAMATITDQCLRSSPSLFRFYCPQLSPFIVPPMFSFPDVPGSCFTAGKKKAITPISV